LCSKLPEGPLRDAVGFASEVLGIPFANFRIAPLAGDASGREYHRLSTKTRSFVLMRGKDRRENRIWVTLGKLLAARDFPVPEILGHDPGTGVCVIQDLGNSRMDKLFEEVRVRREEVFRRSASVGAKTPKPRKRRGGAKRGAGAAAEKKKAAIGELKLAMEKLDECFKSAARELGLFHAGALEAVLPAIKSISPPYCQNFAFEREFRYFVKGIKALGYPPKEIPRGVVKEGAVLAGKVAALSDGGFLIHRDFQSRNIMLLGRSPRVIDFQGARIGPPQYDLASFLHDPYVTVPKDLANEALGEYLSMNRRVPWHPGEALWGEIDLAGVMRLCQAIGAYAKLAVKDGKTAYLAHVPAAAERLRRLLRSDVGKEFPLARELAEAFASWVSEGGLS
jgi:aminoglycoside/choline kinase family phosphotransferase